jgi:hypothetical protein
VGEVVAHARLQLGVVRIVADDQEPHEGISAAEGHESRADRTLTVLEGHGHGDTRVGVVLWCVCAVIDGKNLRSIGSLAGRFDLIVRERLNDLLDLPAPEEAGEPNERLHRIGRWSRRRIR